MDSIKLSAPAKVNYLLDVIARRSDGYHELRMIMQQVNLCDEITISLSLEPGIRVCCNSVNAPGGPDNIAWKAANRLMETAGATVGIDIDICKNIPVAAGLGGGSSDAASVLTGLNELLDLGLSREKLMEIGCSLGADVPFFIFGKSALAEGIGEKLTSIDSMPKCAVLLVNPRVHVSTAWVYRSLQLTGRGTLHKLPEFFESAGQIAGIMSNDLESVTIPAYPVIATIKQRLMELGAAASMMSGSGPTVFGLFENLEAAETAASKIDPETGWFVKAAETLNWGVAKR